MLPIDFRAYVPKLRLKQGEYTSAPELAPDVISKILACWVAPPPSERDPEKRRLMTFQEIVRETGQRLGRHWPLQPSLLDVRFLLASLGEADLDEWLPQLFRIAERSHALPIPVTTLADAEGPRLSAFRKIVDGDGAGMCLRLTLTDLADPDLRARAHRALLKLVIKPHQCLLMLDFSDADLDNTAVAAELVVGAYQRVMEIGLWHQVIFQATGYPSKNPAQPNSIATLPRSEWRVWRTAIESDPTLRDHLLFGDFAADSAKFVFKGGAVQPIRHYRYSTAENWVVVRGSGDRRLIDDMRDVARRLVASRHFVGRAFSRADEAIFALSEDATGPGNATTWRRLNTVHHLTMVVSQLAPVRGFTIAQREAPQFARQASLFDLDDSTSGVDGTARS